MRLVIVMSICLCWFGCAEAQKESKQEALALEVDKVEPSYTRIKGAETLPEVRQSRTAGSTKSSSPIWLTRVGDKIYFLTNFQRGLARLWVTDGTESGTRLLQNIQDLRYEHMVEFKDELYFTTIRSGKRSLWKIAKGAREPVILIDARLTDLNPSKLYPNGGKLFVQGFQQADHLWMLYDAETNELKELQRFPKQAINAVLTDIRNDEPHFFLNVLDYNLSHGKNNMLWYCNGNRESVEFIDTVTINGNSYMGEVLVSGAKLYCTINQQGENDKTWPVLHVVDAEKGTIKPLKDENDNLLIGAKGLSVVGNYIIFSAANSRDVMESPTIVTSTYSYNPKANELVTLHRTSETVRPQFTPNFNHKGLLYFAYGKNRGVHNFDRQLWVTDGTPEGTELVSNIWPLSGYFNNYNFAEEEGEMYFPGGETKHGFEIWKVNSEDKTIQMVTNIEHSDGVNYTSCLTALPGKLIFTHSNLTYGEELWILDSKRERLLIDINKRTGF